MSSTRKFFNIMGFLFAGASVALAVWSRTIPRAARIDFDVTGLLFLLMNLPIVFVWSGVFFFGLFAVYCWRNARKFNQ